MMTNPIGPTTMTCLELGSVPVVHSRSMTDGITPGLLSDYKCTYNNGINVCCIVLLSQTKKTEAEFDKYVKTGSLVAVCSRGGVVQHIMGPVGMRNHLSARNIKEANLLSGDFFVRPPVASESQLFGELSKEQYEKFSVNAKSSLKEKNLLA